MKKIDTHVHVTNRRVPGVVAKSCSVDAVLEKMKKYDIEKSVLLASYFPHKTSGITNFRLLHWIKNRPEFYLFGSLDFEHYFFQGMNELTELGEMNRLDGIKIYTGYQNIDIRGNKMKEVTKLANKYHVPMTFHCGYSHSAMHKYGKPTITEMVGPKHLEFLALENPEINFLAAHMGKPFFKEVIEVTQRTKNIYTDMSGLISSYRQRNELETVTDEVKKYLEIAGPNKLLFGTDFPVQTHGDSVYIVEKAMKNFNDTDKEKVYYNNAWRFLKNE